LETPLRLFFDMELSLVALERIAQMISVMVSGAAFNGAWERMPAKVAEVHEPHVELSPIRYRDRAVATESYRSLTFRRQAAALDRAMQDRAIHDFA
jgi:hypothetical protein